MTDCPLKVCEGKTTIAKDYKDYKLGIKELKLTKPLLATMTVMPTTTKPTGKYYFFHYCLSCRGFQLVAMYN